MPTRLFVRRYPRVTFAAALVLIVVLIGFCWYQSSQVPRYPGAQHIRYETPWQNGEWFCDSGSSETQEEAHTRITRFETAAAPEAVLQFYHAALVDRGPYEMIRHAHRAVFSTQTSPPGPNVTVQVPSL
jgi:hypothetical protein